MWLLATSAGLLSLVPTIQDLVPSALLSGLSRTQIHLSAALLLPALAVMLASTLAERAGHRVLAFCLIGLLASASVFRFVWQVYPLLDSHVSARRQWISSSESITCVSLDARSRRYSLDYYAGQDLPDCK
jgi:hypothetical protein